MFEKSKILKGVCLVVLVTVVVSFIQLKPTKLSGQRLSFVIKDGWRMQVSFEGTVLRIGLRSLGPFEIVEKNGDAFEPFLDEGVDFYFHKDGPAASEFPHYWDIEMLQEGSYEYLVKGADVHVSLVEEFYPYEINHIGEDLTIEVFMFPTVSRIALILSRNLTIIGVLFALLILMFNLSRKIKISWEKRESSFDRGILLIVFVLSIFVLVLLSIVHASKKEYVGDEIVSSVPSNWFLRVKAPSWTYIKVESEGLAHFVPERMNRSQECFDYIMGEANLNQDFIGAPGVSWDITVGERGRYRFRDGYFFRNHFQKVCKGDYTWHLLGEEAFIFVGLLYDNTGEILVQIYPSRQAVYQIIFNNLKLILLTNGLIFATVFAARGIKIKKN